MLKMDVQNTKRFMSFSKDEQDVVKAGIDLYKHYLHNVGKQGYAEFAQGKTYEEKNSLFTESIKREAMKMAGITGIDADKAMRFSNVRECAFALIAEALDVIIPITIQSDFYRLAETRVGGYGDNFVFHIPNPDLFVVSKVANGIRKGEPQKLYSSDVTLTPVAREITIQEDFYRVLTGKVNWGEWVTRIAQSMETQLTTEVYTALYNSYNSLDSGLKYAAFDQDNFVTLAQKVEALNRGAKCMVFGTKLALSKVIPSEQYFRFAAGEEYNKTGYLTNFHGVDLMEIRQTITPGTLNTAIDNSTLYFVSMGVDKPIKIAFEGDTLVMQNQYNTNADMTMEHTIQKRWDIGVITSARFGIMKVS